MSRGKKPMWRVPLIISSLLFAVYTGDVLIAKLQIMMGTVLPIQLDRVVELCVLMISIIFFVVATLSAEREVSRDNGNRE